MVRTRLPLLIVDLGLHHLIALLHHFVHLPHHLHHSLHIAAHHVVMISLRRASRASDSITIFFMLRLRGFVSVEFGIGLHRRNNQLASLSASSMTYAARLLALRFVKP